MSWRAVAAPALVMSLAACGGADAPEAQVARGAEVYGEQCRTCHDVIGAIGVALTDRVIASYGTAERLFEYLRVAMPYGSPGSLERRDYWAVVAYLASSRGARALPVSLDEATAAGVRLPGSATPP